jgi:dienelactone hydrolase
MAALDYARHGADIKGAISVHGLLFPPIDYKLQKIKSKILVLHGFDDPMLPQEQISGFEEEMTKSEADWQMHVFGGTKHAFTNPEANDPAFGTVYNPVATKRTWIEIRSFLKECFE